MNIPTEPLQPHRSSTSCDRHPDDHFTGFCPSCLCERLAVLDSASSAAASTSRKSSSSSATAASAAALKAIFKSSGAAKASFFPELRRTKSFSGGKGEAFSGVFEPQRKSCDVRGRSTLWNLFNLDDERKRDFSTRQNFNFEVERAPVIESREEDYVDANEDEIRVSEDVSVPNLVNAVDEIIEEEDVSVQDMKTMKDHIDLDSQNKKPPGRDFKEIAGSFWTAASVFSKKLQKWRRKQKLKKQNQSSGSGGSATLPVEKPMARQYRETQSEIADYGFGRRSCDTDPRFSLDAGRISFDDPRYSFDEPRASWDGYLIGRAFPRLNPMVSVVEDAPVIVQRSDNQIPVEEPRVSVTEDDTIPGGSIQTRDYYSDSSSRRRKSLDRSNSIRKTAAAVVAEIDEMKSVSNAKVTPATIDYFNGPKLVVTERDLRDSNSNSLRDDCSEIFDMGFRDAASIASMASIAGNGERKGQKKSKRWSKAWNILAFIHRRSGTKDEDEDRFSRGNGVERSFSETWREGNGEAKGFSRRIFRSNSSVSSRNLNLNLNSNSNGIDKKRKEEFVLERNRSARYSPNNIDNGLLRFYLTPLRGSWRSGSGKNKQNNSHSIARSVLRLY